MLVERGLAKTAKFPRDPRGKKVSPPKTTQINAFFLHGIQSRRKEKGEEYSFIHSGQKTH
jgi:hypothetical protein